MKESNKINAAIKDFVNTCLLGLLWIIQLFLNSNSYVGATLYRRKWICTWWCLCIWTFSSLRNSMRCTTVHVAIFYIINAFCLYSMEPYNTLSYRSIHLYSWETWKTLVLSLFSSLILRVSSYPSLTLAMLNIVVQCCWYSMKESYYYAAVLHNVQEHLIDN